MGEILKMTFQEQVELAELYDQKKLEYEAPLATALTSFFIRLGRDFTNVYSAVGEIIDAEEYREELENILTESYGETSDYFSRHFERGLTSQSDSTDEELAEQSAFLLFLLNGIRSKISIEVASYISSHVPKQAGFIIETTNDVLEKSVIKAKEIISESDVLEMDDSTISRTAGKIVNERNLDRVPTIKETEIANASAESSSREATSLQKSIKDNELVYKVLKQWITRLDSSVREAHVITHGQGREVDNLYNVGGESLMYPTDMSHGASLGNTINCRCLSIHT